MRLRIYLDVLRTPFVTRLLSSAVVGRMPTAMAGLALVLLVREAGGSYAVAGLVAGTYSVALALTSPLLGRLVDRVGQTRVLVGCAVASALGFGALAAAGGHVPPVALAGLAALAGASIPPVGACMRALWSDLLGHGGQHGHQRRADHEDQLLHGRLDRERGLEPAAVAEQAGPERPHARPDRRDRRPGEGGQPGQDQRRGRTGGGQGDEGNGTGHGAADQDPGLTDPVDQPPEQRRGQGEGDRVGPGDHPGDRVGAATLPDQQHQGQPGHGRRHPPHHRRGEQPSHRGRAKHIKIDPKAHTSDGARHP